MDTLTKYQIALDIARQLSVLTEEKELNDFGEAVKQLLV
jgi:hypothetical protein